MALKFLNKKGWHTGSLRNIENVWKAEQKHDAEQKKLEVLRQQIREERDRADFRHLQEQAGLIPRQERLDFLYDSGLAVGKGSSSFNVLPSLPGTTTATATSSSAAEKVPGALFEDKQPHSTNEAWRKLHSDPLLLIRQKEQEAIARVKNNPVQMSIIRQSVESEKKDKIKRKHKEKQKKSQSNYSSSYSEFTAENKKDSLQRSYRDSKRLLEPSHGNPLFDRKPLRNLSINSRQYPVNKLSAEERDARLREMQMDAERHEQQRFKRLKKAAENDTQEAMMDGVSLGRNFLDNAQKSVYGAELPRGGGTSTIVESVRRRMHYIQGNSALDTNAFRENEYWSKFFCTDYLKLVFPVFASGVLRYAAILCSTIFLSFLNYTGLTIGGYTAVCVGIVSLLPFFVLSLVSIPNIVPHRWISLCQPAVETGFGGCFSYTLFWNKACTLAGEVDQPQKTNPKALFSAGVLMCLGYLILLLAATGATPLDQKIGLMVTVLIWLLTLLGSG